MPLRAQVYHTDIAVYPARRNQFCLHQPDFMPNKGECQKGEKWFTERLSLF